MEKFDIFSSLGFSLSDAEINLIRVKFSARFRCFNDDVVAHAGADQTRIVIVRQFTNNYCELIEYMYLN